MGALIGILFFLIATAFSILCFVFWVWMLIDCLKNEPSTGNDKIIWGLVIAFTGIGALLYYFIRRPERIKQTGQ
ncbi:MAG: PLDc N-terminal domain-containing protein [Planctomycetes bacterium]|nr:PLDc N-terminal domain-containing protein [Planctomycetota bacterium]MCH9724953.1 PLDc N-terminal domain-containing protein [Planctomycetota bacterium]MCH9777586.1 PLDc N-terminal domain-containing protein [Planctomycetota bacterium]